MTILKAIEDKYDDWMKAPLGEVARLSDEEFDEFLEEHKKVYPRGDVQRDIIVMFRKALALLDVLEEIDA
jgi:hypothetical protein